MSEVELILLTEGENCTLYSIQFASEDKSEYERFYEKFIANAKLNPDLFKIVQIVDRIAEHGALERYFRYEGKHNDSVFALPAFSSKLRLYCLRLSDKILILGNGGIKNSRTYQEDDSLRGYVLTLQKFEKLLKEEADKGTVTITKRSIITDKTLKL